MPVEEVNPQRLHGARPVAAQRARLHQIMLANVLVLKVGPHRDLALEAPIADRTVVWQGLCVRGEVLRQVVLTKKPGTVMELG